MSLRFGSLLLRCVKNPTFPLQINYTQIMMVNKSNQQSNNPLLFPFVYGYSDVKVG